MYEIDLNVRDVNGSSITTDEEFREALELKTLIFQMRLIRIAN